MKVAFFVLKINTPSLPFSIHSQHNVYSACLTNTDLLPVKASPIAFCREVTGASDAKTCLARSSNVGAGPCVTEYPADLLKLFACNLSMAQYSILGDGESTLSLIRHTR